MSREDIMTALFTLMNGAYTFRTYDRRLAMPSKVKEFPALYVISIGEDYAVRPVRGLPPKIVIDAQIWVYANGGKNPDTAPEEDLNNALDAMEAALVPSVMTGVQTLGVDGIQHCWIEGRIEKYPGVIDGIAKAIVPVKILIV